MMKSFFKKLAFMMALSMVVSSTAPAAQTASADEMKKFTYAYQNGGKVTSLRMEVEDEVDLCFKGVKDYANYAKDDFQWKTSDDEVVTVDKNGVVTAVGNGIATVWLKIKNSNYTSDQVKVIVGEVEGEEAPVVVLGVSPDTLCEDGEAYELPVGTLIDLNFYGVENYSLATYSVEWVSSNPDVIEVNQKGEIVAVAEEGEAEISVVIVNKITEETLAVEPALFVVVPAEPEVTEEPTPEVTEEPTPEVTEEPTPEVTEEPTPEPTEEPTPEVTEEPTPEPTEEPTPEPTAEPTPEVTVAPMEAKQITEDDIYVTFAESTEIPVTGNGISVFRVFSAEEMSTMTEDDKKGLVVNEDGEGYAQWYVQSAFVTKDTNNKEYSVAVYEDFRDGVEYSVVKGDNAKTWEIEGIETEVRFVASVGKPIDLKIIQTVTGLAPTETDEAVPAVIKTKFLDIMGIDVTNLYSQDDVEYTIEANEEIGYLSSNNEITFSESGKMLVSALYTYYDELAEKDVEVKSSELGVVVCEDYAAYTGATLYQWSLTRWNADVDWSKPVHSMPAGDEGYSLVVILKDARGNYLTNAVAGTKTKVAGTDKYATMIDYSDDKEIPFEIYGFSVQFESLDSNNLLVGRTDASVLTYTETNSYAAAYLYKDEEIKVREIGIMPINVTEERELDYFTVDKKSLTLLKESEGEDGTKDVYHDEFCVGTIKFKTFDNYNAETNCFDNDYDVDFVVTPTKNAKNETVIMICDAVESLLNDGFGASTSVVTLEFDSEGFEDLSSISFKVTETNTKHSETITIAINEPKYNDNGTKDDKSDDTVFVDANRAILEASSNLLWAHKTGKINLFQVSKSGQKVGYFRLGNAEVNEFDGIEDAGKGATNHGYYISNYLYKEVASNIYTLISKSYAKDLLDNNVALKVYEKADGKYLEAGVATDYTERELRKLYFENVTQDDGSHLEVNDYVLFVTDSKNVAVTASGSSLTASGSSLGLSYNTGDKGVTLTIADVAEDGYTTYLAAGKYKANVYKVEKIDTTTGKITYKTVMGDDFTLTDYKQNVKYYHQTAKKSVAYSLDSYDNILDAIEETMTFTVNGETVDWKENKADGIGFWKDKTDADLCGNWKNGVEVYKIEIAAETHDGKEGVTYIAKDGYVTINTITFRVYTGLGEGAYYETTVNVGRSIYEAE